MPYFKVMYYGILFNMQYSCSLTVADLSMVYSRPELTISFSDAPAILFVNSGLGSIGILPPFLPNFLSSES